MKFVVSALLALAVAQGAVPKNGLRNGTKYSPINRSGKIYNGYVASPGQFPYMAALFIDSNLVCGGSLISNKWVLTAAQCVYEHNEWVVYLGSTNLDNNEVGRVIETTHDAITHEGYVSATHLNDLAVILLPSEVSTSRYIEPVSLPSRTDVGNTYEGEVMTVSGWGSTSDQSDQFGPLLHYARVTVISNAECESVYGYVPLSEMCTSGDHANICTGDEGDPLVDYDANVQVGIVSHGSSSSCQDRSPAVYSRLTSYIEWISMNTGIPLSKKL